MSSEARERRAASRTPSAGRTATLSPPPPPESGQARGALVLTASTRSVSVRLLVQRASAAVYGGAPLAVFQSRPVSSTAGSTVEPSGVPPMSVSASKVIAIVSPLPRAGLTPCVSDRRTLATRGPGSEPQSPSSTPEQLSTW